MLPTAACGTTMAGTPSLTSMLVFATLALLVLYHGFDRVTDLVGHGKSIEAAAEACPAPPGPIQRDMQQWQKIHAALVEELQAAQDAQVRWHPPCAMRRAMAARKEQPGGP